MPNKETLEWLRCYFEESLERHTIACTERLMHEIAPDEHGNRGCAVALALIAFSVLDLFGYLLRSDPNAAREDTYLNLEYIFRGANGLYEPVIGDRQIVLLFSLFRNGVVHQYFPKNAGIARADAELPILVYVNSEDGERDTLVLIVDALAESAIQLVNNVKRKLFNEPDHALTDQFIARLRTMIKEDRDSALRALATRTDGILRVDAMPFTGYPGGPREISPGLPPGD